MLRRKNGDKLNYNTHWSEFFQVRILNEVSMMQRTVRLQSYQLLFRFLKGVHAPQRVPQQALQL